MTTLFPSSADIALPLSEKRCNKCGLVFERAEFHRHPNTADKLLSKCRYCAGYDVARFYDKNPHHYAKYRKEWRERHRHERRWVEEYQRRKAKHPEKVRARSLMSEAIERGRLVRQPCEICGDVRSEGHHDDYSKPLEVRWLCRRHHNQVHGKRNLVAA